MHKIPLMGDLPLLGFAFRYRNSSVRREEFVLFLTPRLVVPKQEGMVSAPPAVGKAVTP
jgi:type II secretory pathway component GspD/PulD (secretin)